MAAAVVINVFMGLRDLYVFRIDPAYPSNALMYCTSMLCGVSLCCVVLIQAMAARTAERTRILRDMHDGVGSHISAAIRQLQSGRASQADVLQTLRDSLDQLKLTIDAMHLPPGDVTALLANLRYRLEPRLRASDIELQWGVELIEPIHGLDAQAMRHLQFMVFEALSNVLQHAQASRLRIEASGAADAVRLRIVDNGRGFDVQAPARKGLASLRERAQAIGAQLLIESRPGQTVVTIVLPVR